MDGDWRVTFFMQTISLFPSLFSVSSPILSWYTLSLSFSFVRISSFLSVFLPCQNLLFPVGFSSLPESLICSLLSCSFFLYLPFPSLSSLYTHIFHSLCLFVSISSSLSLPPCCLYFFLPFLDNFSPRSLSPLSVTSLSPLLDPQL